MIDDDQGRHAGRLQRLDKGGGGRALIIDEDGALVPYKWYGFVVVNKLDPQQLHQGNVLLMADLAGIQDIRRDIKTRTDELVRNGRRNGIRVGEVLKDDNVALALMRLQDFGYGYGLRWGLHVRVSGTLRRSTLPARCAGRIPCAGYGSRLRM